MLTIEEIIIRHINGEANEAEESAFQAWLQESVKHQELFQEIATPHLLQRELQLMGQFDEVLAWKEMQQKKGYPAPIHRTHFLRRGFFRYAAAIILLIGVTIAIVVSSRRQSGKSAPNLAGKATAPDIAPGGDRAYLTLADGTTILLDSAANGKLAQQGNTQIVKLANGQLAYNLKGMGSKAVIMNTMTTPKGGQYQLTLPDGSKVWLNAASSIQFPAAFVGPARNVKISGEAYFEVAQNKKQPFMVDVDGKAKVQVLGTSFNVNSYADEENIKTTLLEGSVKMSNGNQQALLKPGQQARLSMAAGVPNQPLDIVNADIEQTLAWKNGLFNFNGLNIRGVMAQLARWYDIDVRYEGPMPSNVFRGKMYRDVKLSAILQWLQETRVNCRMEGKTIIVTQ